MLHLKQNFTLSRITLKSKNITCQIQKLKPTMLFDIHGIVVKLSIITIYTQFIGIFDQQRKQLNIGVRGLTW